ncbi:MAG: hypothetical protein FJ221_03045 [Lentisphaerae bacterium]|nr:hypothetical protein [Lentisphaerota bacterium]
MSAKRSCIVTAVTAGLACAAAAQSATLAPHPGAGEAVPIAVAVTWSGKIADEALQRLAPESGFIADAAAWTALWRAWRRGEAVPAVDFAKHLVLVATASGPNSVGCEPRLEPNGNVLANAMSTLIGGPGFGYLLQCIPRAGVRAVNGRPLPGEAPLPPAAPKRRGPGRLVPGVAPGSPGQGMDEPVVAPSSGRAGVVSSDAMAPAVVSAGEPAPGAALPPVCEVKDLVPHPGVFDVATWRTPLVLDSAVGAAKHFDAGNMTALAKQADFATQVVLVFAWRGSGQDRLNVAVAESYPEQVFFTLRPGRTRDLREHVRIFALRKNVAWKVNAAK